MAVERPDGAVLLEPVEGVVHLPVGHPRRGEQVVLFLSQWENSTDLRIDADNQGKYLVRQRGGFEVLVSDPVKQGEERLADDGRGRLYRQRRLDEVPDV